MPSLNKHFPLVGMEALGSELLCVFPDTITSEIEVSNTCRYISLKRNKGIMDNKILNIFGKNTNRKKTLKIVEKARYLINSKAKKLLTLYYNIANDWISEHVVTL